MRFLSVNKCGPSFIGTVVAFSAYLSDFMFWDRPTFTAHISTHKTPI